MLDIEEYFDKIYCINLAHRKDRLIAFNKNLKNIGSHKIEYFKAINGYDIIDPRWVHSRGALGCRLSHLTIIKQALELGYDRILIFEDDAVVKKSFKEKISYLINNIGDNWDMIYFGGHHFIQPDYIDATIIRLNNTLTTHAIAINKSCYEKLINKIETDHRWIDSVIAELHPKMRVYGFKNPIVYQLRSYSDVLEMNVNYNVSVIQKFLSLVKRKIKVIINNFKI